MNTKKILSILSIVILFSGCVVYSFYPLYTKEDLFPNDLLLGEWYESEEQQVKGNSLDAVWEFTHRKKEKSEGGGIDSTSYKLVIRDKESIASEFSVHVIQLGGNYFLDFYLTDYPSENMVDLAVFHIFPVHTFAKLTVTKDKLKINWYNQEWLEKLIRENKIRIHHEKNDDYILLTAKPHELQKFVTKYVNSEEAFEEGLEVVLQRK